MTTPALVSGGEIGPTLQAITDLKTGALQDAILTSANFSIIATDETGVIQLFNIEPRACWGTRPSKW